MADSIWKRNSIIDCRFNDTSLRDRSLMRCQNCGNNPNSLNNHCRNCNDSLCQSCVNSFRNGITKDHRCLDSRSTSLSSSTSSLLSSNSNETLDDLGTAPIRPMASDVAWRSNIKQSQNPFTELSRLQFGTDSRVVYPQKELVLRLTGSPEDISKWKSAAKYIKSLMDMYRSRVDEREKELLNELTASVTVKMASLKREFNTYTLIQACYDRSLRILDTVLVHGRPNHILRAKENCSLEIRNARDLQECALFPEEEIVFVPPGNDITNNIRNFGKIIVKEVKTPSATVPKSPPKLQSTSLQEIQKFDDRKPLKTALDNLPSLPTMNAWNRPIKCIKGLTPVPVSAPHVNTMPPNGRISSWKFDYKVAGQSKLVIGREGKNDGELSRPWGVCCTNEGNIVVADRSNHRIQIFKPDGTFLRKFGQLGKEPGDFDRPASVAMDPRGRIFVTDKDNHRIQVLSQTGEFVFLFGKEGKQNGQFHYPWDIAINSVGHVAVTDTRNQRIQLFSNNGAFLRKFGIENVFYLTNHLDSPRGICFNSEGNLVVTDFNNHRLLVIDSNFKKAKSLGGPGPGPKQFMRPQGVAVDNKGKIAVADSRNNRIQIINEDGTYIWQFGSGGTDAGQLDRPCGVCFTPDGKIVVVDFGNNRVQIF